MEIEPDATETACKLPPPPNTKLVIPQSDHALRIVMILISNVIVKSQESISTSHRAFMNTFVDACFKVRV